MEPKNRPDFDLYALARENAGYIGLTQNEGESDDAFKSRVAGVLRSQGKIIEAHEAYSGRRFDDPDQGPLGPMAGIAGAMAQALRGRDYSPNDPERQIGDDLVAGVVATQKDSSRESLVLLFGLLGPEAGMDFLNATRSKK